MYIRACLVIKILCIKDKRLIALLKQTVVISVDVDNKKVVLQIAEKIL